jgi:hypothetical protein
VCMSQQRRPPHLALARSLPLEGVGVTGQGSAGGRRTKPSSGASTASEGVPGEGSSPKPLTRHDDPTITGRVRASTATTHRQQPSLGDSQGGARRA